MLLILFYWSGMIASWIAIVRRDPHPRMGGSQGFATKLAGHAIAVAVSVAWSGLLFWYWESSVRAPWLVHTPWHVITSSLNFIAVYGMIAAWLVQGRPFLVPTAMTLQYVVFLVTTVAPFGFDKQSTWGLDFGHLLALPSIYVMALCGGALAAVASRRRVALWVQIVSLPIAAISVFVAIIVKEL